MRWAIMALAGVLAGCTMQPSATEQLSLARTQRRSDVDLARDQARRGLEDCARSFPARDLQTSVKHARCARDVEVGAFVGRTANYDLILERANMRVELAQDVATGLISPEMARKVWGSLNDDLRAKEARRLAEARETAAEQHALLLEQNMLAEQQRANNLAASLSLIQTGATMMRGVPQPISPPILPPTPPMQTSCQRMGNFLNCTTY